MIKLNQGKKELIKQDLAINQNIEKIASIIDEEETRVTLEGEFLDPVLSAVRESSYKFLAYSRKSISNFFTNLLLYGDLRTYRSEEKKIKKVMNVVI